MKVEIDDESLDRAVVKQLKEYRSYFLKWDGDGMPHISHDKKEENKYRKRMRKSMDMVLEYFGG